MGPQAGKSDSQGSLEEGGESKPCASLGLVKDVPVSPQGPAVSHFCSIDALGYGWLAFDSSFSGSHTRWKLYQQKGS